MVAAVRVHKTGGPEALTYEQIELAAPGPGQIKIKQHAIGVNYIDTYFRMGMYPAPGGMPFIVGQRGRGRGDRGRLRRDRSQGRRPGRRRGGDGRLCRGAAAFRRIAR